MKPLARFGELSGLSRSTLVGLLEFPIDLTPVRLMSVELGWTIWRSPIEAGTSWRVWQVRLSELGIDNGGIVDAGYGPGLSCRDPDNIALEFFTSALSNSVTTSRRTGAISLGCGGLTVR